MEDTIKSIMAEILEIDAAEIAPNFGPDETSNWDSLNNLKLVTALEAEFDIELTMEDIQKMTDFSHIVSEINRYATTA